MLNKEFLMLIHLNFFHRVYALFLFVHYVVLMYSMNVHQYLKFLMHILDLQQEILMVKRQWLSLIIDLLDLQKNFFFILPSEIIAGN